MDMMTSKNFACFLAVTVDILVAILLSLGVWYLGFLTGHYFVFYVVITFLCAMAIMLVARDVYKKTFALFALVIPFVGVGIVAFFGIEKIISFCIKQNPKSKKNQYKEALNYARKSYPDFAKVSEYVDYHTNFPMLFGGEMSFFGDSDKFLESIIESIRGASSFVLLEFYIVRHSQVLCDLLSAVYSALKRGVSVHITVDYFGTGNFAKTETGKSLINAGAKIVVYKPLSCFLGMNFNARTHRKIAVIDGKVGYIGGINFNNEMARPSKDIGLKLGGDGVKQLENMIYRLEGGCYYGNFDATFTQNGFIQPFSVAGKNNLEKIFWSLLHLAKSEVVIATPYLSFDSQTKVIFEYLLSTGVKVTFLLPSKVSKFVSYVNDYFAKLLLDLGAEVYYYNPKFLHEKIIVIDGKYAYVGSANFDLRSFEYQIESGVLICDNRVIDELLLDFNISLGQSTKATEQTFKRSFFKKIAQKAVSLFAYFM